MITVLYDEMVKLIKEILSMFLVKESFLVISNWFWYYEVHEETGNKIWRNLKFRRFGYFLCNVRSFSVFFLSHNYLICGRLVKDEIKTLNSFFGLSDHMCSKQISISNVYICIYTLYIIFLLSSKLLDFNTLFCDQLCKSESLEERRNNC